jgi:hypothetical protein
MFKCEIQPSLAEESKEWVPGEDVEAKAKLKEHLKTDG